MKKSLFSLVLVSVIALLTFSACGLKIDDWIKKNIAEIHNNYFVGETQNYKLSMWDGQREEPYKQDGVASSLVEFCLLSVVPQNGVSAYGLSYTIEIDDKTYNGEFEDSPFDSSLVADIKVNVKSDSTIFVYLVVNQETEIAKMNCISSEFKIDYSQALNIAIDTLKDDALILLNDNKNTIEVYCKIISTDKNLGVYFWFFSIVNSAGEQVTLIIDTNTGEIVIKK